jgi:putative membrane-bound dehydrogenase-like protein
LNLPSSTRSAAIGAFVVVTALALAAEVPPALPPQQAVQTMKVADGLEVKFVAGEPEVRKPVTISFDDRGRLWTVSYLQYPTPNGLKPVKVDQYLRTTYDRLPEPPPKGPKGADRITIFEDPDQNGRFRKSKDFLVGLNLASGMCLGHGGVFVAQPPYLLFYKIKPGTDEPAGDPEVLLTGFGMEDSHAFANSLQWGPDGWLYGAHGSTVTAKINGIEFQQGIWRYHPRTKQFELFAEGGGNTFGLDFDRHGNAIAGTNWGGKAMLHQVQGGYYIKGFGKHGPLHNPYTFGYFDHVPYADFRGGHVTCGGILYNGGTFPEKYNNQYIGANLLSNAIHLHLMEREGSTFKARFGGEVVTTSDTWFRPVDMLVGPDGAVYVADWCDKRANHVDPVDNWDRTKGRVYKIQTPGTKPVTDLNLSKKTSQELLALLSHKNDWYIREARRILAERRDASVIPDLKKLIADNQGQLALDALWALYVSGGFDDALADKLLDHANEDVRTWTIRFLGDTKQVSPALQKRLVTVAARDASPTVRSQLACSCKRLPGKDSLPIVRELLQRKEDVNDPYIPLLLWWAIENKAESDREAVLALIDKTSSWQSPMIRQHILERLARRYMAGGSEADLRTCAQLLDSAPGTAEADLLVSGMEKALEGRYLKEVPTVLRKHLNDRFTAKAGIQTLRFALRLGSAEAYQLALQRVADEKAPAAERIGLVEILGQIGKTDCVPTLLTLLSDAADVKVRGAALAALDSFQDKRIPDTVLSQYPKLPGELKPKAQALLCGRPASALAFLKEVDAKRIAPKEVPLDQLQRIVAYKDKELTQLVEKHWGKVGAQSSGEKISRMRSVNHILNLGKGRPANGKVLFTKHCATCHTLFNEGGKVGPELTGADRKNLNFLLTSIVDPSAFIRPEFVAYTVETKDGRLLNGLILEQTPEAITLVDAKAEKTIIARSKIDGEPTPSATSLMPEKLLDPLDDQEIRDLFSYLQSNEALK